jgi:hypothetical protein
MKQEVILTTTSLVSILLMTFHLADDILFKMSPAGFPNLIAVVIFVVWLYGTLALGATSAFSAVLAAQALWRLPWRVSR